MASERDSWQLSQITDAVQRIKQIVINASPLIECKQLSELIGQQVLLKQEYLLPGGSFKIRGATNKISLELQRHHDNKQLQVIASSSGNHALACSKVCKHLGISNCTMFVPNDVTHTKEQKLRELDCVKVVKCGDEVLQSEIAGRQFAEENQSIACYIPPYGDWEIIFGQATIAYELFPYPDANWSGQLANHVSQLDHVTVLVPVGGGGLAAGVSLYSKLAAAKLSISVTVIGCQPMNDCTMHKSILCNCGLTADEAGATRTISSCTAGGVEQNSPTIEVCRNCIDDWCFVTEQQLATAALQLSEYVGCRIEPGAALPLAALKLLAGKLKPGPIVLIVSGGNVGDDEWSNVVDIANVAS